MGFIKVTADIDGEERHSVIPESALPHMPAWSAVDATDVRDNPWDFEEPDDDTSPDVAAPSVVTVELPDADTPAGNASAAEWRAYALTRGLPEADTYSRDDLRDHYLNDAPLPSKEH